MSLLNHSEKFYSLGFFFFLFFLSVGRCDFIGLNSPAADSEPAVWSLKAQIRQVRQHPVLVVLCLDIDTVVPSCLFIVIFYLREQAVT